MRPVHVWLPVVALGCAWWTASPLCGQQVTIGTPMNSISDGFFENMGVSGGFRGNGINGRFGGANASPQFGGANPSAGLNFGIGAMGKGGSAFLNGNFSQGFSQSLTSQTPSMTLQNGIPGYISDTSQSPFVIGYVPVVGGFPTIGYWNPGPLAPVTSQGNSAILQALERANAQRAAVDNQQAIVPAAQAAIQAQADLGQRQMQRGPRPRPQGQAAAGAKPQNDLALVGGGPADAAADEAASRLVHAHASSAGRAAPSVEEARRLHEAEKQQSGHDEEIDEYLARAENAASQGKPAVARQYYRLALQRASADQRGVIQSKLDALSSAAK